MSATILMNKQLLQTPARELLQAAGAVTTAQFAIGQIVRHRMFSFRGVVVDVDPVFNNSEEWYEAIPAHLRPKKTQPFYYLLAQNDTNAYEAYVSEQNLRPDDENGPITHPLVEHAFCGLSEQGRYYLRQEFCH